MAAYAPVPPYANGCRQQIGTPFGLSTVLAGCLLWDGLPAGLRLQRPQFC